MRSLFRAFRTARVRYLVISGQASVLYGAALFSQDLDLWIDPTVGNVRNMLRALGELRARFHKLTPPLTQDLLRRGHGFHFVVPMRPGPELYLDVMGQPPRVGGFGRSSRRARRMKTPWGTLPVVSIEDLVEIKKTNRPADYEVITRLALIRLRERARPDAGLRLWAVRNVFSVDGLLEVLRACGPVVSPAARHLRPYVAAKKEPPESVLARAGRVLAREATRLQEIGRSYWIPRLRELRVLRGKGLLIPEGLPVREWTTRADERR